MHDVQITYARIFFRRKMGFGFENTHGNLFLVRQELELFSSDLVYLEAGRTLCTENITAVGRRGEGSQSTKMMRSRLAIAVFVRGKDEIPACLTLLG